MRLKPLYPNGVEPTENAKARVLPTPTRRGKRNPRGQSSEANANIGAKHEIPDNVVANTKNGAVANKVANRHGKHAVANKVKRNAYMKDHMAKKRGKA